MKITTLVTGRRFADAIPDGQNFRLRFMDGFEVLCTWGDDGPEAIGYASGVITAETILHQQFQYVRNKMVDKVMTNGETLIICFTDGHELRSRFSGGGVTVEGIDAKVRLAL